jgi:hypothetical protein
MAVIIISPVLASASPAAKISKPAAQAQKESGQQNCSASVSSKNERRLASETKKLRPVAYQ